MNDKKSITNWLVFVGPAITLLAPALYILGYLFGEGYLTEYGVHPDFFQRSAQEYFMMSFQVVLIIVTSLINFISKNLAVLMWLALGLGVVSYIVFRFERSRSKGWLDSKRQVALASDHAVEIGGSILIGVSAFYIPLFFVLVLIILLLIPGAGHFKGRDHAKDEMKKYKECSIRKADDKRCAYIFEGEKLILKGDVIARSNTHLAVYAGKVVIMPLKDYVIEIRENGK